jgi:hypothetical protein
LDTVTEERTPKKLIKKKRYNSSILKKDLSSMKANKTSKKSTKATSKKHMKKTKARKMDAR